jgi:hypothetical protein
MVENVIRSRFRSDWQLDEEGERVEWVAVPEATDGKPSGGYLTLLTTARRGTEQKESDCLPERSK